MYDFIKIFPQYILPKKALSKIVDYLARVEFKLWKNVLIKTIVTLYKVDLKEAQREQVADYVSFNDFFTRHLKPTARHFPINTTSILSPVDGAISQIGNLQGNRLIQAKGKDYGLEQLLGHDTESVRRLHNGLFTTLYLSPRDYHRIHMPATGTLKKSIYISGERFGVGDATVRNVRDLFARNERFVSIFETEMGMMALVMVGAIFVGSMETVWLGQIQPSKKQRLLVQDDTAKPITLNQGQEFGHFNMGSTVILIFEQDRLHWSPDLTLNSPIQVGQALGKVQKTKSV